MIFILLVFLVLFFSFKNRLTEQQCHKQTVTTNLFSSPGEGTGLGSSSQALLSFTPTLHISYFINQAVQHHEGRRLGEGALLGYQTHNVELHLHHLNKPKSQKSVMKTMWVDPSSEYLFFLHASKIMTGAGQKQGPIPKKGTVH